MNVSHDRPQTVHSTTTDMLDEAPRTRAGATLHGHDVDKLWRYAALSGGYAASFLAFLGLAKLPKRIAAGDVILLGVATHALTRVLARDKVTAVVRAPFTTPVRSGGAGEVVEKPRGRGIRYALGELMTCPYCLGPWAAAALVGAFVKKPRPTRVAAATLTIVAISDFLHQAYAAMKKLS